MTRTFKPLNEQREGTARLDKKNSVLRMAIRLFFYMINRLPTDRPGLIRFCILHRIGAELTYFGEYCWGIDYLKDSVTRFSNLVFPFGH
jgi:hypothetical protein